jgi:hypothetical protein
MRPELPDRIAIQQLGTSVTRPTPARTAPCSSSSDHPRDRRELAWKVDWLMRCALERMTFGPAGERDAIAASRPSTSHRSNARFAGDAARSLVASPTLLRAGIDPVDCSNYSICGQPPAGSAALRMRQILRTSTTRWGIRGGNGFPNNAAQRGNPHRRGYGTPERTWLASERVRLGFSFAAPLGEGYPPSRSRSRRQKP